MFAFQLWREFKLSIAELCAVFSEYQLIFHNKEVAIFDIHNTEDVLKKMSFCGGIIKVIWPLLMETETNTSNYILKKAQRNEWKFQYGINIFWPQEKLKTMLSKQKNILRENAISSRFVNKDFTNLSSAQIWGEHLVQKWNDFNIIYAKNDIYIWTTIWVQNINEYSGRDYAKERDMHVGMLPPKLAQMMLNIAYGNDTKKMVYDPFVWLWTILIEASFRGNTYIYGSDISEKMMEISKKNIVKFTQEHGIVLEKCEIFVQNAQYIHEVAFLQNNSQINIVTEWYLWEVMTQNNMNIERIEKQRKLLLPLYEWFFAGLIKSNFWGNIVISFPFWEHEKKYYYFEEIYILLQKYCEILPFFPENKGLESTKAWSLLYKRDKQLVGREIFKLKLKN